jgi:hypothetical protein
VRTPLNMQTWLRHSTRSFHSILLRLAVIMPTVLQCLEKRLISNSDTRKCYAVTMSVVTNKLNTAGRSMLPLDSLLPGLYAAYAVRSGVATASPAGSMNRGSDP